MNKPNYFIVTCPGNCATTWLATCLSLHPEIFCSHSLSKHKSEDNLVGRVNDINSHDKLPFVDILTKLADKNLDNKYIGNIHGYTVTSFINNLRQHPVKIDVKVVNLIRNPINWVTSSHGNFIKQSKYSTFSLFQILHKFNSNYVYFNDVAAKHNVDPMDWDFIFFAAACVRLTEVKSDFTFAGNIKHKKMEDITQNKDDFIKLLEEITSGELSITDEYIDQIFNTEKINQHNKHATTADSQFEAWLPWQKEIFIAYIKNLDLLKDYQKIGYDLWFCRVC